MKWRLMAAFAALVALVLIAQDVPLAGYLRDVERERLLSDLRSDAFLLAGVAANVLSGEDPSVDYLQPTVETYAAQGGAYVVIVNHDGVLIASSNGEDHIGQLFTNESRPEFTAALSGTPTSGSRTSVDAGGDIVFVAVPVRSGQAVIGVVRITFPANVIEERANRRVRGLVLVGLVSLTAAACAAIIVANTIVSPLKRLQRRTEQLSAGDFSQQAPTDEGPPEVRSLARSFNKMTERIAALVESQRAFVGDASHQLRTPLTALRLQLERAASTVDHDPEGTRDLLEAATHETERLQRLVEGLLMIARSDGSTPTLEREDVSAILRERAGLWGPFAEERRINLRVDCPEGLEATAVPNAIEQIIDNFVDNAIGVSSSGDTVLVTASRTNDHIRVEVIDEGPGMQQEHLARAFDRFWRAPRAPHGGSGIGLAVVHQLAALSGAAVALQNRTDRSGLIAVVELRAADSH